MFLVLTNGTVCHRFQTEGRKYVWAFGPKPGFEIFLWRYLMTDDCSFAKIGNTESFSHLHQL